uniref:Histone deacetylase complex subunit SAP18 n=1 Tax=Hucho hucho TaxID=62062 RepID=A0A4W5RRT9_9TELE
MALESRITQEEIRKIPEKPIDREKTCPLLLRVFTTNGGRHHRGDEFARGQVPSSELQIYTWMDASLKELTSLVKEVYPEARKKGTHFGFAIVYPEPKRNSYRLCQRYDMKAQSKQHSGSISATTKSVEAQVSTSLLFWSRASHAITV